MSDKKNGLEARGFGACHVANDPLSQSIGQEQEIQDGISFCRTHKSSVKRPDPAWAAWRASLRQRARWGREESDQDVKSSCTCGDWPKSCGCQARIHKPHLLLTFHLTGVHLDPRKNQLSRWRHFMARNGTRSYLERV